MRDCANKSNAQCFSDQQSKDSSLPAQRGCHDVQPSGCKSTLAGSYVGKIIAKKFPEWEGVSSSDAHPDMRCSQSQAIARTTAACGPVFNRRTTGQKLIGNGIFFIK